MPALNGNTFPIFSTQEQRYYTLHRKESVLLCATSLFTLKMKKGLPLSKLPERSVWNVCGIKQWSNQPWWCNQYVFWPLVLCLGQRSCINLTRETENNSIMLFSGPESLTWRDVSSRMLICMVSCVEFWGLTPSGFDTREFVTHNSNHQDTAFLFGQEQIHWIKSARHTTSTTSAWLGCDIHTHGRQQTKANH